MKLPRECRFAIFMKFIEKTRVVELMIFHQTVEYEYFRSIAIDTESGERPIFLGIAGISIFKTQTKGTMVRKKLIKGPTLEIDADLEEVDARLLELKQGDVTYELTSQEYNSLQSLVSESPIEFWTYRKEKKY